MENILEQPFTIEKCEAFNQYCKENKKRIEQIGDKRYALDYNEIVVDGQIIVNPNYEEEQAQAERERINNLTCTKRVFALMLQELGITYTMLKQLIATNEQAQLEWDLCVELERGNPLIDVFGQQLGITSEQIDGLFKYANGEITIEDFRALYVVEVINEDN
jgi:hypothetical protein